MPFDENDLERLGASIRAGAARREDRLGDLVTAEQRHRRRQLAGVAVLVTILVVGAAFAIVQRPRGALDVASEGEAIPGSSAGSPTIGPCRGGPSTWSTFASTSTSTGAGGPVRGAVEQRPVLRGQTPSSSTPTTGPTTSMVPTSPPPSQTTIVTSPASSLPVSSLPAGSVPRNPAGTTTRPPVSSVTTTEPAPTTPPWSTRETQAPDTTTTAPASRACCGSAFGAPAPGEVRTDARHEVRFEALPAAYAAYGEPTCHAVARVLLHDGQSVRPLGTVTVHLAGGRVPGSPVERDGAIADDPSVVEETSVQRTIKGQELAADVHAYRRNGDTSAPTLADVTLTTPSATIVVFTGDATDGTQLAYELLRDADLHRLFGI